MSISSNLNCLSVGGSDANAEWTTIEKRKSKNTKRQSHFKADPSPIQQKTSSIFHAKVPKIPQVAIHTRRKVLSTPAQCFFNKKIHACEDLESAKKLLKTMIKQEIRPDVFTYTSLISKCKKPTNTPPRGEFLEQAEQFLKEMLSKEIDPDVKIYSSLIAVCATVGDSPKAEQFLKEMLSKGIQPNVITYSSLITVCAKVGDLSKAEQFLKEMLSKKIDPNVKTYSSLIAVCATVGNLPKAEQFLKKMRSNGIKPDLFAYSSLIDVCATVGNLPKAEQFLKEIHSKGIQPNVITYSSLITVCAKVGDLSKAEQFLKKMRSKGIEPDLITYNSLIDVCAAVGNLPRAEQFLKEMSDKEIAPNIKTYNNMIRISHSDSKQVQEYLKKMEDSNLHFNSQTFSILMEYCAENETLSKTELALDLFNQMIDKKIEIDDIVKHSLFNALICKNHTLIKYSDLFRELFKKQLKESAHSSSIDCHDFSHGAACFFLATRLESLTKERQVTVITGKGNHREKNWGIMHEKVTTFIQQNCPLWELKHTDNEGRLTLVKKPAKVN